MERNIEISQNKLVEDLGTGRAYINLFIREKSVEALDIDTDATVISRTAIIAEQQFTLENPITRARIINRAVELNFPDGANEAAIRKGIEDANNPDFVELNEFIQRVKDDIAKHQIV